MKSVAQVLNVAADCIERSGWCQGIYYRGAKCCAAGALMRAGSSVDHDCFADAWMLLAGLCGGDIATWNDAPERSQAEVVAKLREAAKLAEAEASHV